MSVRRAILIAMTVIGVAAVSAAVSLTVLTDRLSQAMSVLSSNLESVRAAQQVEVNLLVHAHAQDKLTRTVLENDLFKELQVVKQDVTSQEEADAIAAADSSLAAYLEAT